MNTIKLLAIMITLVMVSACLNQPTRTSSSHSSSNPSHSPPTASPRGVIDVNPPKIIDFNYTPTKVVWDKVCDVRVSFRVVDDEGRINRVVLKFIPVEYEYFITKYGMRPEDYPKVFPPEKERVYELKPVDGVFDELKEEFSVEIKNITGGREYKIIITAEDEAGNTRKFEYKTPYIRQYENFGRQLYEKGIIVGASYMPWDFGCIPMKDGYTPIMGKYDTLDDIVQWKHIDWAGYAGINVFWISSNLESEREKEVIRKFLSRKGIKIEIMIGPHEKMKRGEKDLPEWGIDLSNDYNSRIFLKIVKNGREFYAHPSYLRSDGEPVLYIWDEAALFNQEEVYREIKETYNVSIVADWLPSIPTLPDDQYVEYLLENYRGAGLEEVDAYTGWIGFHKVGTDTKTLVNNYLYYYERALKEWKAFTKSSGKIFIVTVTPGFDNSYSWGGPQVPLPRSPELFGKRLRIAMKYLDEEHREVKIDTWNDYGEWSYIEPSQNEGFVYLDVLKQVLEEYLENVTSPEPQVLDFNWTPTKVIWDKVYDIKVSFKVSYPPDEISSVKLIFKPENYSYFITEYGMRREDYYKVFPNDSRVYELEPVDGVLDEPMEEFEVNITNITGGAEYWIIIQIQTKNGRTIEYKTKTPYIRQYENFGRQLYEKGIIVGTPYYLWYREDLSNWHDYGHKYTPLIGTYKSSDPTVISKHIDWATGYGVNLFLVSWSGYEEGDLKFFDENLQLMFNLEISKDIYIAILYESVGRLISRPAPVYISFNDEENVDILTNDLEYLAKTYFSKENYLHMEGRPVIYLYGSKGYTGDLESALRKIRNAIINEHGTDLFMISDHAHPLADINDPVWINRLKQFDGVTVWLGGYLPDGKYVGGSYNDQLKSNYFKWYNLTHELGVF